MTPTRAGLFGALIGGISVATAAGVALLAQDALTYSPHTASGTCDHAEYRFSLSTLDSGVVGDVVIIEPDNLDLREPNPNWLVRWGGGSEVERITTEGIGSPTASSFARLADTDEGGTRSVWIKRSDAATWCKIKSTLG
jgi:hypothetical protein